MGKRNGKRKKKRDSRLTGPGGISAWSGAGARVAVWAGGPLDPPVGETAWGQRRDGTVARAHMPEEGCGGAGSIGLGGRGGGGSRGWCGEGGAWAVLFIGARGGVREEGRQAPTSSP
jgi:hypothetical protein